MVRKQVDLVGRFTGHDRVVRRIQRRRIDRSGHRELPAFAAAGDRPRAAGRFEQRRQMDRIGVGEPAAGADHGPHADALVDVETAGLDDAVFQAPGLGLAVLEIKVAEIDLPGHQPADHPIEIVRLQLRRGQKLFRCQLQHVVKSLGLVPIPTFGPSSTKERNAFLPQMNANERR
jgi:hypothetical protein